MCPTRRPRLLSSATLAVVLVTAGEARSAPADDAGFVGLKLGGIVPFAGLSPFPSAGVELGWVLPPLQRRLALVLAVDYTQPTASGTEMDPRVTGGSYTWSLTERELALMPALIYRATMVTRFTPYAGIGPRILFLQSTIGDDGAPAFSDTTEVSTKIGVGVPLGAEIRLGPGRLLVELLLQYGALDHVATGDSHTGAAGLSVGYRAFF